MHQNTTFVFKLLNANNNLDINVCFDEFIQLVSYWFNVWVYSKARGMLTYRRNCVTCCGLLVDAEIHLHQNRSYYYCPVCEVTILLLAKIPHWNSFVSLLLWVQEYILHHVRSHSYCHKGSHVEAISSKATQRLYFLKLLKRAGVPNAQLLHFYQAVLRPILEYAAPVWHHLLSTNQMSGWSDWSSTEKSSQYHLCLHLWHALS